MTVVHGRPQIVTVVEGKLVGIACRSGICRRKSISLLSLALGAPEPSSPTSHVRKLFAAALEIVAVLGLDGILNGTWDWVIHTQDGALNQLDLTSRISTQISTTTVSTSRGLSLAPGLDGRSLAAGVRRGNPTRHSKGRCGAVGVARVNGTSRVRIVISGCRVGGVGLGQAVAGRGADRGDAPRMGVVKRCCKRALLMREQSPRGILIFPILENPSSVLFSLTRETTQRELDNSYLGGGHILQTMALIVTGRVRA